MDSILNVLDMGGYSFYVWPAYGLVCAVLVMNLVGLRWQRKQTISRLKKWFKR